MGKITPEDVEEVARLAQLTLDDDATRRLAEEMGAILSYLDKLNDLNTDQVEPMLHVPDRVNVYREDEVQPSLTREEAFQNAPQTDSEYFLVPKILEG
ncbi:MAG: Asp-tRNA(Asn)/Glu-tRNA(Gln) amidotransferase subunit GatC [Candidatus Hydrogenedentales bacterium]